MFIHTYDLKKDEDGVGEGPWHVAAFTCPRHYHVIQEWCHRTFGPDRVDHNTHQLRWKDQIYYGEVYFSRKEDLTWFVLRWS